MVVNHLRPLPPCILHPCSAANRRHRATVLIATNLNSGLQMDTLQPRCTFAAAVPFSQSYEHGREQQRRIDMKLMKDINVR